VPDVDEREVEVFAEPHKGARGGPADQGIGRLTLTGNTGRYLDAPYHRYPNGADLSAIPLARTVDLAAIVVRVTGSHQHGIDVGALAAHDVRARPYCCYRR
jgi:kynurenine formamidase